MVAGLPKAVGCNSKSIGAPPRQDAMSATYLMWFEHIQPPLGNTFRIPTPTHRRTFKVLLISIKFGCSWRSRGGPTNQLFVHIFDSASLGGPLEGTGSPKDPHRHQNDIKMDPETDKMTLKPTPRGHGGGFAEGSLDIYK